MNDSRPSNPNNTLGEMEDPVALAERVLDRPFADPDDELAILARQFTRHREYAQQWHRLVESIATMLSVNSALGLKEIGPEIATAISTLQMHFRPPSDETNDAADAAKWRALRDCARITAMGCAGLTQATYTADDAYAHLTLNFWTGIPDGDPGPAYAREWLDKFVAKALRPAQKASEPLCMCARCQLERQVAAQNGIQQP